MLDPRDPQAQLFAAAYQAATKPSLATRIYLYIRLYFWILFCGIFLNSLVLWLLPILILRECKLRYPRAAYWKPVLLLTILTTIIGYIGFCGLLAYQLKGELALILGPFRDWITTVERLRPYPANYTAQTANQFLNALCTVLPPAPAPLHQIAIDQPLLLALCAVPSGIIALVFPFYASRTQKLTVKAEQKRKQQQLATRTKKQQTKLDRAAVEKEALKKRPDLMELGHIYNRTWNPFKAQWELQLPPLQPSLYLTPANLNRHFLIVAPTRAGKTANFIRPLINYSRRLNAAAIFFDPKGYDFNPNLFDLSFSMQPAEYDSSVRLCLIDPAIAAYDPLGAARKLSEALIPEAQERYYSDAARDAMAAFMLAHYLVFNGRYPEMTVILAYCSDKERREALAARIRQLANDNQEETGRRELAEDAINLLNVTENRANAKGDPLGSLYNALGPLGTGRFKQYVTTDPVQGVTVRQIINQRLIARIAFTETDGELGKGLGKILVQQFADVVLDPTIDKTYLKMLVIDEAHRYICPAMATITAQAAGSQAGIVLAMQSLNQITDPDMRAVIRDNCKNKAILAGVGNEDADTFSRFLGEKELEYVGSNVSTGSNAGQNISSSSGVSQMSHSEGQQQGTSYAQSSSKGQNFSYQRRPLWLPSEISQIPRYHAVVTLDNGESRHIGEACLIECLPEQERQINESLLPYPEIHSVQLDPRQLVKTPLTRFNSNDLLAATTTPPPAATNLPTGATTAPATTSSDDESDDEEGATTPPTLPIGTAEGAAMPTTQTGPQQQQSSAAAPLLDGEI